MSGSLRIERWKQVYSSDPSTLYVIPPEHHPYAWLIPRWWYKGSRTIYETCVKVQGPTYQMFIDGLTPAMTFEFEITDDADNKLIIKEARDVRRIVVTDGYSEILEVDGEYLDVEKTFADGWIVRKNTLPAPIVDVPPSYTSNVQWMKNGVLYPSLNTEGTTLGADIGAQAGTYTGGMPGPNGEDLKFRGRWQVRDAAAALFNGPWITLTNDHQIVAYNPLESDTYWPTDPAEIRFMTQVRDYKPDGSTRTLNQFTPYTDIEPALAVQTAAVLDAGNVYEPGNTLTGTTATFVGGIEPITYQYRWQAGAEVLRDNPGPKDGGQFNSPWTQTSNGGLTDVGYTVGQYANFVRLQSQATDATGRVVDSFTETATIILPPPVEN